MNSHQASNWSDLAKEFTWKTDFKSELSGGFEKGDITWFKEGSLNICENLLDRNIEAGLGEKTAFFWEPNELNNSLKKSFSYNEVLTEVSKFSNALKESGIKKGDVIAIYMPMVPEAVFASLACSRIGAVHTIVFGGFSKEALRSRLIDSKTKLIVTAKTCYRGNKTIDLLGVAQEASKDLDHLSHLVFVDNSDTSANEQSGLNQISYTDFVKGMPTTFEPVYVEAEHPLFILYTSGSTGKPKGLVHTTGGYMVWSAFTFKEVFQFQDDDVFWCTADIGWITGHSYFLYGPFLNGATQVMFEGVPTYPNPDRFWKVIEKYKVSHFYTAPTAIRSLQCLGDDWVLNSDLSSLKVLGSVGEPINLEAWQWYNDIVGKKECEIVDTWWQTETGGVMISNIPGKTQAKPCLATKPLSGINPALLDQNANVVHDNNQEGILCISKPWPGIARTILNDHNRYLETYMKPFPGYYYTGDGAKRDDDGDYRIIGRIDDVVNVSGHRIGTAEVEDVINKSGLVIESAVVGIPDETTGQALLAFGIVSSTDSSEVLENKVNEAIKEKIGSFSKVKKFVIVKDLPKTRSGKIMRRLLRKVATKDENLGDTSTLLNPDCILEIKKSLY